jgi:hypothetical protein
VIARTAATVYELRRELFLTAVLGHTATQRQANTIADTRLAAGAAPGNGGQGLPSAASARRAEGAQEAEHPLAMDAEAMRRVGYATIDALVGRLASETDPVIRRAREVRRTRSAPQAHQQGLSLAGRRGTGRPD